MMTAANFGEALLETIHSKDAQKSVSVVQQYRQSMMDPTVGGDYVTWITEPANLTRVHKAVAEDLNVPPRAMAIKRMLMSRPQRANLLMQAVELAIKRVHGLN
jgi:hypothetical protein